MFAVKGGRFITHNKKLRDCTTPLANFFASGVLALEEKLGPILWQLPPQLPFDEQRLEDFFGHPAADDGRPPRSSGPATTTASKHGTYLDVDADRPIRHALEVRHETYRDPSFVELLRTHDVALVIADTAGKWPYLEDVTADFVYVRLHGEKQLYVSGYDCTALDRWAERIAAWRDGREPRDAVLAAPGTAPPRRPSRDVYVYFDNDAEGARSVRRDEPRCAPRTVEVLAVTEERVSATARIRRGDASAGDVGGGGAHSRGWVYEIKYDGYRAIATLDHGKVRIASRSGQDWTVNSPRWPARSPTSGRRRPFRRGDCLRHGGRADPFPEVAECTQSQGRRLTPRLLRLRPAPLRRHRPERRAADREEGHAPRPSKANARR